MTENPHLIHAVSFLQNAYTIVLALALGEALKQLVPDGKKIRTDYIWSLVAFLFLIFPFFHGMSRYFYSTYLAPKKVVPISDYWAAFLMGDGIAFMLMAACFFIMSRSLGYDQWKRFYLFLAVLLVVDSIWIAVGVCRGVPEIWKWLVLNLILGLVMLIVFSNHTKKWKASWACAACALTIIGTTSFSYWWMSSFYFS